jgi:hypothetical protein
MPFAVQSFETVIPPVVLVNDVMSTTAGKGMGVGKKTLPYDIPFLALITFLCSSKTAADTHVRQQ